MEPTGSADLHPVLAGRPGHLLWRAHARVTSVLAEVLPPDVDIHAHAALLALDGGVTRSQQEVADAVSTSRTTIAKVAADLVARGLVERVRNPADRRSYALTRTAAGGRAVRSWQAHADALEASLTAPFTDAERRDLHALLLRVLADAVPDDVPDAVRGSLGFAISRVHARLHRDFLSALEPLGLEPRLFGALNLLTATGPVAQADLARGLGTSGPTLVQIADSLEGLGLVERRRDPDDRRTQLLHVLPAAEPVLAEARAIGDAVERRRLGVLTAAEKRRLVRLLRHFVTAAPA